jgi:hypothetical protein
MRDTNPLAVRLPADLKTKITDAAAESRRSLNAEMVVRLEKSFGRPLADYTDGQLIEELMSRYGRGELFIRVGLPPSERQS